MARLSIHTHTPFLYMDEPYKPRSTAWVPEDYPNIYQWEHGPTDDTLSAATTALGVFFCSHCLRCGEDIAGKSDDYFLGKLNYRVASQHEKQRARQRKHPDFQV
ncbi:hypothetical protein PPTG_21800 [Phytophthora nicotianae INRA-310]|uniref:Uncharacterized protein n=2 Tax=Phytophthora nicotianae TaxID=4792 RepID=W2QVF2_PHYN3|nr:hypothetical protein PPTG_21800 [Phytophthora nicotianae INRA-310]ETN16906.1 hypothetical protein PPTG_21800 [Phytophthora nicotianae INRA-310]